jgi:Domain of unknown function (DUF4411)
MAYLLDANTFIEAKNTYYGQDFCPGFWDWLDQANAHGRVFSIEHIQRELAAGGDALATWAKAQGTGFFLAPDPPLVPALTTVAGWASAAGYPPAAVNQFFQAADYYLVAHALAHGHVVVTRERPGATKRIKIPDACIALGITCLSPFDMLRAEGVRLVLSS